MSRKKQRSGRKYKTEEREFTGWGDYAEDLVPFLSLGRRSETGSGWLEVGCEAGSYCGEMGEDCEATGYPHTQA